MNLGPIITFIDDQIKVITSNPLKLAYSEISKARQILSRIKQLLQESQDGNNLKKLVEVISLIENLKIKGFLHSTYKMKQKIKDARYPILNKEDLTSIQFVPVIPGAYAKIFLPIHTHVFKALRMKTPKWCYTYPLQQGEVMNDPIGEWQNNYMHLVQDKKNYADYTRDIAIQDLHMKYDEDNKRIKFTEEEIFQALSNLVEKTAYLTEDRPILLHWLESNGNQDINRFIHHLFLAGHFYHIGSLPGQTKAAQQCWSVNARGKISCYIDYAIYTVNQGVNSTIIINTENNDLTLHDYGAKITDIEDYLRIKEPLPVMRILAEIELDINMSKIVKPKIINLKAYSYTDLLKPLYYSTEHKDKPRSLDFQAYTLAKFC